MSVCNVAIIGLGRVGSAFLQRMLHQERNGLYVVAVSELRETPGLIMAQEEGIRCLTVDEIICLGPKVDIIFDLTGEKRLREDIRRKLSITDNSHTVLAPESVARLIWTIICDKIKFPDHHDSQGYC